MIGLPKQMAGCICEVGMSQAKMDATAYETYGRQIFPELSADERVSVETFASMDRGSFQIIDVRPANHFELASIDGSRNIPLNSLSRAIQDGTLSVSPQDTIVVVCRQGNDSRIAVRHLRSAGFCDARDLIGGLKAWNAKVDHSFPFF